MGWKNGLLITTQYICTLFFCCTNDSSTAARQGKDSLITAGTAVNGANNIVSYLSQSKEHSRFINLLKKAGLIETLNQPGPFTVFAPTNEAFEKLSVSGMENWDSKDLQNFLSNHIVAGALEIDDLGKINKLNTLSGEELRVRTKKNKITVNGKLILGSSFTCTNGLVYLIEETLAPAK